VYTVAHSGNYVAAQHVECKGLATNRRMSRSPAPRFAAILRMVTPVPGRKVSFAEKILPLFLAQELFLIRSVQA
jgi:hypothetical protein